MRGPVVRNIYILIAVLYPVAVMAAFAYMIGADSFAIFKQPYTITWFVFVPGALILLTIGLAFTGRAPGRLWRLALIVWIGLVTWSHNALIGIVASGV
jgi:hypothetical protein